MKIGIVGFGFVGSALNDALKNNVKVKIIDPRLNTKIDDLVEHAPDFIFVCVPTPMKNDGTQDLKILNQVIDELENKVPNTNIVIKSTVLPNYLKKISDRDLKIIYNPEFLRELFAREDFINAKFILFGSDNDKNFNELKKFYKTYTYCRTKEFVTTDLITASIVKYSINSFLAAKVIFFNELFEVFKRLDNEPSWKDFIKILQLDERIGSSHMDVPGHDGMKGFGGACFPKDINALYNFTQSMNQSMGILKYVISKNNSIRKSYNKTDREIEQNIIFDID